MVVEVPRGGRIKWSSDGDIDFISPIASPFNYGSVIGLDGEDGDPADALILGQRLVRNATIRCVCVGVLRFIDDGFGDDKLVCLPPGQIALPTPTEWRSVRRFFVRYAFVKRQWRRIRGAKGDTRVLALDRDPPNLDLLRVPEPR